MYYSFSSSVFSMQSATTTMLKMLTSLIFIDYLTCCIMSFEYTPFLIIGDGNIAFHEGEVSPVGTQKGTMEFNLSFVDQSNQEDSDEGLLEEESEGAYSLKAEEEDNSDVVVSKTVITIVQ